MDGAYRYENDWAGTNRTKMSPITGNSSQHTHIQYIRLDKLTQEIETISNED